MVSHEEVYFLLLYFMQFLSPDCTGAQILFLTFSPKTNTPTSACANGLREVPP